MERLRELVLASLTETQKQILAKAREEERISFFVNKLSKELGCSDSTLWKSIRSLGEKQLLENEDKIKLTRVGSFIVEVM